MSIITLISDWGLNDHKVAVLKFHLQEQFPVAQLIDITHSIEPSDLLFTEIIVKSIVHQFPEGTIHYISVQNTPEVTPNNSRIPCVLKINGQFFLTCNNGVFGKSAEQFPDAELWEINDAFSNPLTSRDPFKYVYKTVIDCLLNNNDLNSVATKIDNSIYSSITRPVKIENSYNGTIIFNDRGRMITNFDRTIFENHASAELEIMFRNNSRQKISKVCENYNDGKYGDLLAIFNDADLMEFGFVGGNTINNNTVDIVFGLEVGDSVRVIFTEKGSVASLEELLSMR